LIANPRETLTGIIATLKMLKAMFHKKTLRDLRNAIAVVILPLLIGMAMRQLSFLDGVIQKALDPLRNRLSGIYQKMGDISRLAERLSVPTGMSVPCNRHDLTGAIKQAMLRGAVRQAGNWVQLSNVDRLSKGLNVVRDTLNWAVEMPERSRAEAQRQVLKMIDKRTFSTGSRLETLSSLRSVDSLIAVCNGVLQEMQLANATPNLTTNAIRQAAGSAQPAVDLPRLISSIQVPVDMTLRTVSPQSADTTQISGDLLERQLEVLAELDPILEIPENVREVLASAGSFNLDLPDSATVPFFQQSELTQ
jgi:hypothetical protein